jgi:hypothetical protein
MSTPKKCPVSQIRNSSRKTTRKESKEAMKMSQKVFIEARGLENDYSATVAKFDIEKALLKERTS